MIKTHLLKLMWILILLVQNTVNSEILNSTKPIECGSKKSPSILDGLIKSVTKHNVNSQCYFDMLHLKEGLESRETWALKVLDASAKKSSGFIVGNNHWLGSQFTCKSINNKILSSTTNQTKASNIADLLQTIAPIEVAFKMVYAKHESPFQINDNVFEEHLLHIGVCLPLSCSTSDTFNLTNLYFTQEFNSDDFLSIVEVLYVKDLKIRDGFFKKPTVLFIGIIFLFSLSMAFIAQTEENIIKAATEKGHENASVTTISYFSIEKNLNWVYDTRQLSQSINIIYGLKAVFTFLVLAGHTQIFSFFALSNTYHMFHNVENLMTPAYAKLAFLVDVFLTMSGFLLAHQFLGNKQQMENIKNSGFGRNVKLFGKMVLKRYLRLLPLYIVTILLVDIFTTLIEDTSYFRVNGYINSDCQKTWCKHLFLIQNWFEMKNMCFIWSWYLATEMQVFVAFLLLLFIYAKNQALGKTIFIIFTCGMSMLTLFATVWFEFQPTIDIIFATGAELYNSPLARISPYFPGVMAGALYTTHKNNPDKVLKKLKASLIMFSFLGITLFNMINEDHSVWISSLCYVCTRWSLSFAIALFILVDTLGGHTAYTKWLSSAVFVHIGKIEYAIYILNPLVIIVLSSFSGAGVFMDGTMALMMLITASVITYGGAVILTVLIERPCSLLTNKSLKL